MATEIKFDDKNKTVTFGSLKDGDKFTVVKDTTVYMKMPKLYHHSGDMYLKNAVNILNGSPAEFSIDKLVLPVDVSITVYR